MIFLREDSQGQAVVRLQKQLKIFGLNPGKIDGDFGPATKAAVIAFQKSRGLLAEGIAGHRTLTALATIRAETECFEPICEAKSKYTPHPAAALTTCTISEPIWAIVTEGMGIASKVAVLSN